MILSPSIVKRVAVAIGVGLLGWSAAAAAAQTRSSMVLTPGSAIVEEILDGNQLYIDDRQARVKQKAFTPEQVKTGLSRGQLTFNSGAAARINRHSQLRLGQSCFLLSRGQILVSGPQNGCTRSARLSVRGTNYLVEVAENGEAVLTVLEGSVLLQRLSHASAKEEPSTLVDAGQSVRLSESGVILSMSLLSPDDYARILQGPLFEGFRTPLPAMAALLSHLRRTAPGTGTTGGSDLASFQAAAPLLQAINDIRGRNGRAPLLPLPADAERFNGPYMKDLAQAILSQPVCDHDLQLWETLQTTARSTLPFRPVSELIACPRKLAQWNPEAIVGTWMSSSLHYNLLLNRPSATHISCHQFSRGEVALAICNTWASNRPNLAGT